MTVNTNTFPRHRLMLLAAVMVGFGLIVSWQLVRWQVIERDRFVYLVQSRPTDTHQRPLRRGRILDRQGHPLALDTIEYEITATPDWIRQTEDVNELALRLSTLLALPTEEIAAKLSSDAPWVLLKRRVPRNVGEALREWDILGLHVTPAPRRGYPEGTLAAHLLGFVTEDRRGFYGIEGYYEPLLAFSTYLNGKNAITDTLASFAAMEVLPFDPADIAAEGSPDLVLTVDRMIQYIVEEELEAAISRHQASGGTIIVMEPHSGAILAMASRKVFDPERYDEALPESWSDPAVTLDYEPGSVFKIVTLAAALDSGLVDQGSIFEDKGMVEVGGRPIYNWDRQAHGEVTVVEAMAFSLNTVMAQISTELGPKKFYAYAQRFGFGQPTGVDLAGESRGQLRLPTDAEWHESDLGTNAFGQGLAVTPLQMACAMAAIANDGQMMTPHAVKQVVSGHQTWPRHPTVAQQVVTAQTAEQLTQILIETVEKGAPKAIVPGYTVAGKSGTAEIPIPGGYDPQATIASFVGFAPARDPRFLILVKIDRPQDTPWGAAVAAPVFRNIAQRLFVMMDIPPDRE